MPYFDNVFHWCISVACSDKTSGRKTIVARCYTVDAGKCRNVGIHSLLLKTIHNKPQKSRLLGLIKRLICFVYRYLSIPFLHQLSFPLFTFSSSSRWRPSLLLENSLW